MNHVPFDPAEQQIVDTLHRLRPDLVTCCQRLLRIPSVNGVHDEVDVAQEIAAYAQHLGLDVQRIDQHPQRPVLSISTSPREATGLLLVGHMDTVAPGDPTSWTYPPFSGTLAGGRIYGRGAIDNKSGIAAALYALAVLAEHTAVLPAGRAKLVCVPDEESGATGELGIKVLAQTGLLQGRGAIYTYAGSDILLGHRGVLRYRLTCRGEAIHTGSHRWQHQQAGANAVTGLARLLLALEAIQFPSSSQHFFEQHRTILTPGTLIRGGSGVNIVPDHCEALLDIRTTPEIDRQQIESRLEAQIAHLVKLQPRLTYQYECLTHIPAVCSSEHTPLFAILDRVVRRVRQTTPMWTVAGPANEGYLLINQGIPTACGLGPLGANAHAANEYVEVDSLVEASLIYALTARQLAV